MFNIIAGVIGVAIAVALVGAMMFFGGEMFQDRSKVFYAEARNEAAQIESAMYMYRTDRGAWPSSEEFYSELHENDYLASDMRVRGWSIGELNGLPILQKNVEDTQLCSAVNKLDGRILEDAAEFDGCPPCTDSAFTGWPACNQNIAALPEDGE